MILPLDLKIPNYGPPVLRNRVRDLWLRVGDSFPFKFSARSDPDREDFIFLEVLDFGKAEEFITGTFPKYYIKPFDNDTHPGVYKVKLKLTDNNPNPLSSTYWFRITVEPKFKNDRNEIIPQPNEESQAKVKIKSISSTGMVTVGFTHPMNVPANYSYIIGSDILDLQVRPGNDQKKEFLGIKSWNVTCTFLT
jgi:hypothetical protein